MKVTRRLTSNGKHYPIRVGKREWVIVLTNRVGNAIKQNRASTFDRALSRAVVNLKKYGASGAYIEHFESPANKERAELHRIKRQGKAIITIDTSRKSSFSTYVAG